MGNTLKRIQQNGFMNWQHRPCVANDAAATQNGLWISYAVDVSNELEEAIAEEAEEPVWTIECSALYQGEQVLFHGDIAVRLGGPLIHRAQDKSVKEMRRVAYGFFLEEKGNFQSGYKRGIKECPEKTLLLSSDSCCKIFRQLSILANRDFHVEDGIKIEDAFIPVPESISSKFTPCKDSFAAPVYFQIQVKDERGANHIVIVQQFDYDFVTVEDSVIRSLQNTDSKVAALIIEEARISMILDAMSQTLCTPTGSVFTRVEVEVDTTQSRKAKQ